jgi:hypothetical protein
LAGTVAAERGDEKIDSIHVVISIKLEKFYYLGKLAKGYGQNFFSFNFSWVFETAFLVNVA